MENNVDLYENFFLSLLKYEKLLNNNKLHLNRNLKIIQNWIIHTIFNQQIEQLYTSHLK